jgi:hypothetical protein
MPREAKIGATRGSYVYRLRVPDDLRKQWDGYCEKKGQKSAAYMRALMRFLIQDEMPQEVRSYFYEQVERGQDDGPKQRIEVRFTPSEFAALQDMSEQEEVSPQRWIVNAVRASLTHEPQFTMEVLKGLWESTYQLRAIGRNLNQIAKRMNEANLAGAPIDPPTLEAIQDLAGTISGHTHEVGRVINASLNRWAVEPI